MDVETSWTRLDHWYIANEQRHCRQSGDCKRNSVDEIATRLIGASGSYGQVLPAATSSRCFIKECKTLFHEFLFVLCDPEISILPCSHVTLACIAKDSVHASFAHTVECSAMVLIG